VRRIHITPILLKPSAVARALAAFAFLVVLVSTVGQLIKFLTGHDELMGLLSLTFVDDENNIPTLFSVLLLALAALCVALVAVLAKKHGAPDVWRWALLSAGFLYLAFDDGLSLHERLRVPIRALLGISSFSTSYSYWILRGLAVVLFLIAVFGKFLRRLPAKTRYTFLLAALLYLGGAVGFDLIGMAYSRVHGGNLMYSMIATVEESLEMAGVILFIYAILAYIAETYQEVRLRVSDTPV